MVRLLLDESLPWRAASWLRDRGVDVLHLHDLGLASAPDDRILAAAREDSRVCITLDHDFHAILAESGATNPSGVLRRVPQSSSVEAAELIARVVEEFREQLVQGAATVTRRGVRLRRLPLR